MDSIVLHTIQLLQHCKTLQSLIRLAEEQSVSFSNFKIFCQLHSIKQWIFKHHNFL
jgi:hypothetical protein